MLSAPRTVQLSPSLQRGSKFQTETLPKKGVTEGLLIKYILVGKNWPGATINTNVIDVVNIGQMNGRACAMTTVRAVGHDM